MEEPKLQEEEIEPKRPKIIKKGGHGGHHGGAWKVAYADLVTAMMALFLVLWLVSQADTQLKEQIANYFKSPGVFTGSKGGILPGKTKVSKEPAKLSNDAKDISLFGIAQQLQKKFKDGGKFSKLGEKVVVEVVEEGIQIEILDRADNISFEVGSSILNRDALVILKEIASVICAMPNKLKIAGHTDRRVFPSNNGYTNWELSTDRANSARRALVESCVSPKQIARVTGYADTDPIISRDAYHPANRRISITVLKDPNLDADEDETKIDDDGNPIMPDPAKDVIDDKDDRLDRMRRRIERERVGPTLEDREEASAQRVVKKVQKKPDEKSEKEKAQDALKKTGKVQVGEPDVIPKAPRRTEKTKEKPGPMPS